MLYWHLFPLGKGAIIVEDTLFINKWVREKELSGRMCDCFLDKVKVQIGKQLEVVFKFAEK